MKIDSIILLFLNSFTGNYFFLDFFFYFLANIIPYLIVIVLAFFLVRNWKKNVWFVGEVLFAGLFARYGLVSLVRYIFPRERPFQLIEEINLLLPFKDSLSFPSGHTAFLFAIATAVYFYNKNIGIFLFSVAFLGGVARVVSGMHWPTDVFTGALVGILGGLIISELSKLMQKKLTRKKKKI